MSVSSPFVRHVGKTRTTTSDAPERLRRPIQRLGERHPVGRAARPAAAERTLVDVVPHVHGTPGAHRRPCGCRARRRSRRERPMRPPCSRRSSGVPLSPTSASVSTTTASRRESLLLELADHDRARAAPWTASARGACCRPAGTRGSPGTRDPTRGAAPSGRPSRRRDAFATNGTVAERDDGRQHESRCRPPASPATFGDAERRRGPHRDHRVALHAPRRAADARRDELHSLARCHLHEEHVVRRTCVSPSVSPAASRARGS